MESIIALIKGMGIFHLQWGQAVMIAVSLLLLWLAISRKFEPLLLLPIGFGGLLSNIPEAGLAMTALENLLHLGSPEQIAVIAAQLGVSPDLAAIKTEMTSAPISTINQLEALSVDMGYSAGILALFYKVAIGYGIAPLVIFMGVGAMTDFGPLLANPKTLLLGAAAQFGIFATVLGALALNYFGIIEFTLPQAASIGIIGGADGPTAIFTTIKLAPHLLGPIAIAAYSYMALVPVIIPLVVKLFCTKKELSINMKEQEKKYPSKTEIKNLRVLKIIFPIVVTTIVALFVPSAVPLVGMLMFGNLVKEIGTNTFRLFDAASNSIMNAATIFLGLSVGATMTAEAFLNWTTIGIVIGGFLAFALSITGGIFFVKLVNLFSKKKINPLIGATGLSAVPMASRVANEIALKYDPKNHVLQYCMASNISGVIGSAVAAGVLISFLA
mgnify:FL=1